VQVLWYRLSSQPFKKPLDHCFIYSRREGRRGQTDSQKRFSTGYLLTKDAQTWYHQQYLRIEADRDDWKASPVFAENLTGVAPAFILTCGYDPLVDEGREYAEMLQHAGVQVIFRCHEGQVHGFITMGRAIDEANKAIQEFSDCIANAFQ